MLTSLQFTRKLINLSIISACIFMLVSCQKETVQPVVKVSQPVEKHFDTSWMQRVSVEDGVLVFANQNDYRAAIEYLQHASLSEREMLEAKWGFKSQRTLYDQVLQVETAVIDAEEAKIFAQYPDKTIEELYAMNFPSHTHTAVYEEAMKTGIFHIEEGNNGNLYSIQILDQPAAHVVNYDGLVKVGDELRQHVRNYYKVWKGGDIALKEKLISTWVSTERDHITVTDYRTIIGGAGTRNRSFGWTKNINADGSWLADAQTSFSQIWKQGARDWRARIGVVGVANSYTEGTYTTTCGQVIDMEGSYDISLYYVRFDAQRKAILGNNWTSEFASFAWENSTWSFGDFVTGTPTTTIKSGFCKVGYTNTYTWYPNLLNSLEVDYPNQVHVLSLANIYDEGTNFSKYLDPMGFDAYLNPVLYPGVYFAIFPTVSFSFSALVNTNGNVTLTGGSN